MLLSSIPNHHNMRLFSLSISLSVQMQIQCFIQHAKPLTRETGRETLIISTPTELYPNTFKVEAEVAVLIKFSKF